MRKTCCKNCCSFTSSAEDGRGECAVSGCMVNASCEGCIDWRYYKI